MLTLYYSPRTRASRVVGLLMAMGKLDAVEVQTVQIARGDGAGGPDPRNPHPDGKVPVLMAEGEMIRESAAIFLYLTDHFGGPMGRAVGESGRGRYLSWLVWNGNIVEPVIAAHVGGFADAEMMRTSFRGKAEMDAALVARLEESPWLVDDRPSAADILNASLYWWFPQMAPENAAVRDWVARAQALVCPEALEAYEGAAMKTLGLE